MTIIKFCGMTREEDVARAVELGVDLMGFVLWPASPRSVSVDRLAALINRLPSHVTPVGVFVRPSTDDIAKGVAAGIRVAQLHGVARPDLPWTGAACLAPAPEVWVATSIDAGVAQIPLGVMLLLDTHDPQRHGGTGRTIDWKRASRVATTRRVMLAGGLTPANVGEAIRKVRPYGVDVASGIEDRPGVKNAHAMQAFVAAVREADQ